MADQHQLDMLRQGRNTWNTWRKQHPLLQPDLSNADLSGADFSYADFRNADFSYANLRNADLSGAKLFGTNLSYANLRNADLSGADLSGANLRNADLSSTDLSSARVGWTQFNDTDLRTVRGLETVQHTGPSYISIDTFYRSEGHIPEAFLRKTGVPEDFIIYMHSLVNRPIAYYTCFISYSSHDQEFADRLYADLQSKGVRCWFAPEEMKIGESIRDRIDQSIRLYDKLLLVLSEQSMMSEWVEDEVEAAMEKERQARERGEERTVLFPVRLDEVVKTTTKAWAAKLRRQRQIGDFSSWKHHDDYHKALTRLLRDLQPDTPPKESIP